MEAAHVILKALDNSDRPPNRKGGVVFLTGAGLSKASGLPTRQDMWSEMSKTAAVSVSGVKEDSSRLWGAIRSFYEDFLGRTRYQYTKPMPNCGHDAISHISQLINVSSVITQNVDGLHEASMKGKTGVIRSCDTTVLPIHGNLDDLYCPQCGREETNWTALSACAAGKDAAGFRVPTCRFCGDKSSKRRLTEPTPLSESVLLPRVVLFGERVDTAMYAQCAYEVANADAVVVVGTALDVAPAAVLVSLIDRSVPVIDFNTSATKSGLTNYWVPGESHKTLWGLLQALLESSQNQFRGRTQQ